MINILKSIATRAGLFAALFAPGVLATGCEQDQTSAVSVSSEEIFAGYRAANIPVTIHSNASWTASCDAAWCTLSQTSGRGTTDIDLLVEALTGSTKRVATITVATRSGEKTLIKLTQHGATTSEVRVAPKTITIGPKVSSGNTFTVATQYREAVVAAEVIAYTGVGTGWVTNLTPAATITGNAKLVRYTFSALENTDAYERTATIRVTVTFARQTYTEEVLVVQNGLGAPAISTPANAYIAHSQTQHTQHMWVENGDQTNVTYTCLISCNHSGTGSQTVEPWITGAYVDAQGVLRIATRQNTYDEVREGDVLIVAKRGAATTKLNVHVIQSGHKTAGLHLPTSVVTHTSATGSYTLPLNPLNDSKVAVEANNSGGWVNGLAIAANGILGYTLDAYNGAQGDYREATLTLKVTNGHSDAAYYYLTVRQYAPLAAGISLPTALVTHNAGQTGGVLPFTPLNGSTVEVVGTYAGWLGNVSAANQAISYSVAAYDGSEGPYREAVITVRATNAHANAAYYQVTVRQYAPQAAGISLPASLVTHNSFAGSETLPVNALNHSTVTVADVSASWITGATINGNGMLTYVFQGYNGAQGDYREAVITLKAVNSNFNAAYYYLTVRQYAPSMPGISAHSQTLVYDYTGGSKSVSLNPLAGSTLTVVGPTAPGWLSVNGISAANVLTFTLGQYTGGQAGDFREEVITLKATNSHADESYYYLTVRQYAPATPSISLPVQTITVNAEGSGTTLNPSTLPLTAQNGAIVEVVGIDSADDWMARPTYSGGSLYYVVPPYNGAGGPVREAVITLKASNNNSDAAYYYITVRQYAPEMPAISLPVSTLTHDATAGTVTLPLNPLAGTNVQASAASTDSWITGVSTTGNTLTVTMQANTATTPEYREAIITLIATNAHADQSVYYVTVRQYSEAAAGINTPPPYLGVDSDGTSGAFTLNPLNGTTSVTVVDKPSWVTTASVNASTYVFSYTVPAWTGSGVNSSRTGVITIKASKSTGNDAYYYITVRQYSNQMASLARSDVNFNHTGGAYYISVNNPGNSLSVNTSNIPVAATGGGCGVTPTPASPVVTITNQTSTGFTITAGAFSSVCSGTTSTHYLYWEAPIYVTVTYGTVTQILTLSFYQNTL